MSRSSVLQQMPIQPLSTEWSGNAENAGEVHQITAAMSQPSHGE
jgi:hypothetical protein